MGSLKFEFAQSDGTRHFSSWSKKLKALLVKHKLEMAIQDPSTLASTVTDVQKKEMQEITYSIIVLYLADNVLRQIDGIETTYEAWNKLHELFITKSLSNRILLKEKSFGFHMDQNKNLGRIWMTSNELQLLWLQLMKRKLGMRAKQLFC